MSDEIGFPPVVRGRRRAWVPASLLVLAGVTACSLFGDAADPEVDEYLRSFGTRYRELSTAVAEAMWSSSTDVSDANSAAVVTAQSAYSEYVGSREVLEKARALAGREEISPLQRRELDKVRYLAENYPGTIPDVVAERIAAEERQSATMNAFVFELEDGAGGKRTVTANEIDAILKNATDLEERRRAWECAKSIGPPLRAGLVDLQRLRNATAREMGYPGYFGYQVADYGMTSPEMMALLTQILDEIQPLYEQLHLYTRRTLAKRYGVPTPSRIPAHWLGNRWGQEWPGIVKGIDLDPLFQRLTPQQIVEMSQAFYESMGFPALPASFYERSDLYELPAGATRKKNTHASAWHVDLDQDVRSLMSVKADFQWFTTTHHELGHIHYYLAYSRDEVPYVLREGANRAFHEGIGELISLAASQQSYLRDVGIMKGQAIDDIAWLLDDALKSVPLLAWAAGVMSHFEHDLYDGSLPPDEWNARWWQYVQYFQGIDPPAPRGEEYCDAATKTHINDDPAQYYDYALATVLKFQFHEHVATKILKTDLRDANYRGSKAAGDFLRSLLAPGATRDWRELLKETTGEELSARAMLAYYQPLYDWLVKQNEGAAPRFRD